jgi:predicted transcriptional regulator
MGSRRQLTAQEDAERERLRRIWDAKKDELHLTQSKAAKVLGYTNQTAVSQYLNGHIPLNLEAAVKFCTLLKVDVKDISERFSKMVEVKPKPVVRIPVSSLAGIEYQVALNDVLAPHVRNGDLMIIDKNDLSGKGLSLPTGRIVAVLTESKE